MLETQCCPEHLTSVWAGHFSEESEQCFYKYWHNSKLKASTKYQKRIGEASKEGAPLAAEVKLGQNKAHINEIQVNGDTTEKKVDLVMGLCNVWLLCVSLCCHR